MTKAELMQYRAIDRELRGLEDAMAKLRARMESPAKAAMRHAPAKSGTTDPMGDAVAQYDELLELYNAKWDGLIDLQKRIEEAIEVLEPLERTIFRARYIQGATWDEVYDAANYCKNVVHTRHRAALKILAHNRTKTCGNI